MTEQTVPTLVPNLADPAERRPVRLWNNAMRAAHALNLKLDPATSQAAATLTAATEARAELAQRAETLGEKIEQAAINADARELERLAADRHAITTARELLEDHGLNKKRNAAVIAAYRADMENRREKIADMFAKAGAEFLGAYAEGFNSHRIDMESLIESQAHAKHWGTMKRAAETMDGAAAILDALDDVQTKAEPQRYVRNLAYIAEPDVPAENPGRHVSERTTWTADPVFRPVRHWLEHAHRTPRPGAAIEFAYDPAQQDQDTEDFTRLLHTFSNSGMASKYHHVTNYAPAWWAKQNS